MIPQNIPINGRIAIVDDQINQARPLMELFGRKRIPYIYYNSELKGLPEIGSSENDFRVVFLDINLIDDSRRQDKEIKSTLIAVLNRLISDKNYPYLIVYWSRHANEYDELVKELFETVPLKDKKPISFLSASKQDYWDLDGNLMGDGEESFETLFQKIKEELNKFPIYGHLLNWENRVHISADKTLEEAFKLNSSEDDWNNDSKNLFFKLAQAYAGKNLASQKVSEQVKSACLALNSIFTDSLEFSIGNNFDNTSLEGSKLSDQVKLVLSNLNKKLLISPETQPSNHPGLLLKCNTKGRTRDFENLISSSFKNGNKILKDETIKRESIFLLVTPLCDFVQNKFVFNKLIGGTLIDAKHADVFPNDAVFKSPAFKLSDNEGDKVIVLNFAHLLSQKRISLKSFTPLFRVRQQLLAEIQSKLSRHLNRQGVLFIDPR